MNQNIDMSKKFASESFHGKTITDIVLFSAVGETNLLKSKSMQRISFSLASHDNVTSNDCYRIYVVKVGDSQAYKYLYPGFVFPIGKIQNVFE